MELTHSHSFFQAKQIAANQRKDIALAAINNEQSITQIAEQNQVSRKFVYQQKEKAVTGIEQAFKSEPIDDKVIFLLPITKIWLCQFILCLLLHCRCSFRGVTKVLNDAFDYHISIGTIYNISQQAKQTAQLINNKQDLSAIKLGAHDELFQHNKPVLAGIDIPSLYCYLLSQENQRDADTWAIHLWNLERQKFNPDRIIADDAAGLRLGHHIALPKVPCDMDNFHITQDLMEMRRFFRNRLSSAITYHLKIQHKMIKAIKTKYHQKYSRRLGIAEQHEQQMQYLSNTIDTLVSWMQHDVLNMTGPNPTIRRDLYNFIVEELKKLADIHPHRIENIVITLKNQRELLLAFTDVLNEKFKSISEQFNYPLQTIWNMCELLRCKIGSDHYAVRSLPLQDQLGDYFDAIEDAVILAISKTQRTSSMVENLNSGLRPYFLLRREIGHDYLELLRFYLNHTPFLRSDDPSRVKKTPTEILTGLPHNHWLEMLGFKRFKRAA